MILGGRFMSKKLVMLIGVALLTVFATACATMSSQPVVEPMAQEVAEHPVEMEGKLCATCHAPESTDENAADPTAYTEWYDSLHGINMVTCTTCHGGEENFMPVSSLTTCQTCHDGTETAENLVKQMGDAHTFIPVKSSK